MAGLGYADAIGELRALVGRRVLVQMRTSRGAADQLTTRGVLGVPKMLGDVGLAFPVGAEGEVILHFDQLAEFARASVSSGTVVVWFKGGAVLRCQADDEEKEG